MLVCYFERNICSSFSLVRGTFWLNIHVITVGESRPVSSCILTSPIARSASPLRAAGAASSCLDSSFSYFSRYIRMVAPADPVPESLKTARAVSPFSYSKLRMRPCFDVCEPSTGSVYLPVLVEGSCHGNVDTVSKTNMQVWREAETVVRTKEFRTHSPEFFGTNQLDSRLITRNCGTISIDKVIPDKVHHLVGSIGVNCLIIVPAIEMTTIRAPVLSDDVFDANQWLALRCILIGLHQDGHPR